MDLQDATRRKVELRARATLRKYRLLLNRPTEHLTWKVGRTWASTYPPITLSSKLTQHFHEEGAVEYMINIDKLCFEKKSFVVSFAKTDLPNCSEKDFFFNTRTYQDFVNKIVRNHKNSSYSTTLTLLRLCYIIMTEIRQCSCSLNKFSTREQSSITTIFIKKRSWPSVATHVRKNTSRRRHAVTFVVRTPN